MSVQAVWQCNTQTNVVYLYSLVLLLSEDDTPLPKHVGVLITVTNCILLSVPPPLLDIICCVVLCCVMMLVMY